MKKNLLVAVAIASLVVTSVAFAEGQNAGSADGETTKTQWQIKQEELKTQREAAQAERQTNVEARKTEMESKKQEALAQRCAQIQERVSARFTSFGENNGKRMAVYANMKNRISKFITRLSGEGYDTAKIQADLVVLGTMIQQFETDKQAQMAKLQETHSLACGHSDGEFKGGLTEARTLLTKVHADAMAIRKYMLETVRPDILALKKQKVEAVKSTSDSETPDSEESKKDHATDIVPVTTTSPVPTTTDSNEQ